MFTETDDPDRCFVCVNAMDLHQWFMQDFSLIIYNHDDL